MITAIVIASLIAAPCTKTHHLQEGEKTPCGPADLVPLDRGAWLLECRSTDLPKAEADLAACRRERIDADAACADREAAAKAEARALREALDACRLRPVDVPPAPSVWASPAPWAMLALGLAAGAALALALD